MKFIGSLLSLLISRKMGDVDMGSKNNFLESLFSSWTGIVNINLIVGKPAEDVLSILETKMANPQKSGVTPETISCSKGWSVLEKNGREASLKAKNGNLIFSIDVDAKSKNESALHVRAAPAEGKMFSNFFDTLGNPDVQTERLVNYLLEGLRGK